MDKRLVLLPRVPILKKASVEDRQRLLGLFPVAKLRVSFTSKSSKEAICKAAAKSSDQANLDKIADFADKNLNTCKQHIHVFSHAGDAVLPDSLQGGERVIEAEDHAFYLVRVAFDVVVLAELKKAKIEFLWPVRIDIDPKYMVVRFIVLEKNLSAYFDSPTLVQGKSLDEEVIVSGILADGTLSAADLNKGIKELWASDSFDAVRTRYKKPRSVAWEAMDEEQGIKQCNPALYEELRTKPMYLTAFKSRNDESSIQAFTSDPTNGLIGFTQYSKEGGDSDELIRKILKGN